MDYGQEWWQRLLFASPMVGETIELVVSWHQQLPEVDDSQWLEKMQSRQIIPDPESVSWITDQYKALYGSDLIGYFRREPKHANDYTLIFRVRVTQDGYEKWKRET